MPKGVEHTISLWATGTSWRVILPLMPKGVEHSESEVEDMMRVNVILPLMPKGVEHLSLQDTIQRVVLRDPSSDAERR